MAGEAPVERCGKSSVWGRHYCDAVGWPSVAARAASGAEYGRRKGLPEEMDEGGNLPVPSIPG